MIDIAVAAGSSTAFWPSKDVQADASGTSEGLYVLRSREVPDWERACMGRIDRLKELPANWDSYGANQVDHNAVRLAKMLIQALSGVVGVPCPNIAPTPGGNVGLSWSWHDDLTELDVEIRPDGCILFAFSDELAPERDEEGEATPEKILQLLTRW